jgi:hypothetical protein
LNSLCDEGVVRVAIESKPAKKKATKPVLPKVAKVSKALKK